MTAPYDIHEIDSILDYLLAVDIDNGSMAPGGSTDKKSRWKLHKRGRGVKDTTTTLFTNSDSGALKKAGKRQNFVVGNDYAITLFEIQDVSLFLNTVSFAEIHDLFCPLIEDGEENESCSINISKNNNNNDNNNNFNDKKSNNLNIPISNNNNKGLSAKTPANSYASAYSFTSCQSSLASSFDSQNSFGTPVGDGLDYSNNNSTNTNNNMKNTNNLHTQKNNDIIKNETGDGIGFDFDDLVTQINNLEASEEDLDQLK